jgi:hypothetical protein
LAEFTGEPGRELGVYHTASLKVLASRRFVMLELRNKIARLEICSEQLRLHLRSLPRTSAEAEEVRSDLLAMLQTLAKLKDRRQRLAAELKLEEAA